MYRLFSEFFGERPTDVDKRLVNDVAHVQTGECLDPLLFDETDDADARLAELYDVLGVRQGERLVVHTVAHVADEPRKVALSRQLDKILDAEVYLEEYSQSK